MNCSKVKRLLSRYIDKELLEQNVITQIEEHLKVCPDCKAELQSLVSTGALISQKERIAVGEDFLARLKDRLRPQPQVVRLRWLPEAGDLARRLIPVPIVATMLMFALVFSRLNGLNPVDQYIVADLSNEEIGILGGYIDDSDLLNLVFE